MLYAVFSDSQRKPWTIVDGSEVEELDPFSNSWLRVVHKTNSSGRFLDSSKREVSDEVNAYYWETDLNEWDG